MTREHMVEDQRFAAARPDVLVYETEPLTERRDPGRPARRRACSSRPPAPIPIGS